MLELLSDWLWGLPLQPSSHLMLEKMLEVQWESRSEEMSDHWWVFEWEGTMEHPLVEMWEVELVFE
jgi:hypothetical protein